jgi:hypothetical protein
MEKWSNWQTGSWCWFYGCLSHSYPFVRTLCILEMLTLALTLQMFFKPYIFFCQLILYLVQFPDKWFSFIYVQMVCLLKKSFWDSSLLRPCLLCRLGSSRFSYTARFVLFFVIVVLTWFVFKSSFFTQFALFCIVRQQFTVTFCLWLDNCVSIIY